MKKLNVKETVRVIKKSGTKSFLIRDLVFLFPFFLSACEAPAPVKSILNLFQGSAPASSKATATSSPAADSNDAKLNSVKANAQLLTEMVQVLFQKKEIEDQGMFSSLVSSLDQGASLEGIYRGLVMGSQYRVLESHAKAASPDAIKFFATEMGELQASMKSPTQFTKDTAKQIPTIEYPQGEESSGTADSTARGNGASNGTDSNGTDGNNSVVQALGEGGPDSLTFGDDDPTAKNKKHHRQAHAKSAATPASDPNSGLNASSGAQMSTTRKSQAEITDEMLQDFIGATPFTLKRVLCDEVMKKMDEFGATATGSTGSAGDLAQWYATFVVRMAGAGTDFGLPQRNSTDFDFHFRFAKTMSLDRVKWEVVNRYQRVLNRLN